MEHNRSFTEILKSLEQALAATHLAARPLWVRGHNEDVAEIAKQIHRSAHDFSHVPLHNGSGRVTHVLYREDIPRRAAGPPIRIAKPLDVAHTVPANASVAEVIERIQKAGFLLVHPADEPGTFDGIINHADLAKLPLRIWLFAAFAEVEDRLRSRLMGLDPTDPTLEGRRLQGPADLPAEYRMHFIDLMEVAWWKRLWFTQLEDDQAKELFQRLNRRRNAVVHASDGAHSRGWRIVVKQLQTTTQNLRLALDELR